ncbi:hypothetical protein [Pseudooceanicola sp.]|uniref:hypothetical protein n=1 Tax=Pseudooceanicola sp. TaxID=1914328 RepID=UPI0035C74149
MNSLKFHILDRLAREGEVDASEFPDFRSTLELLVQSEEIERRSIGTGVRFRITEKGMQHTARDPSVVPPNPMS